MKRDAVDWTHEMMLNDVKRGIERDRPECMMVIALHNEGGRYDTRFWNVGMSVSQMVALLEVQKARLVETMRNGAV